MSLQAQPPSRTSKSKFNPDQDPRAAFPNLEDYFAIKNACLADYKDASPPTELQLKECAKYLSEWSGVQVIDQWKLGEPSGRPAAVVEVAVRYMSGCTIFRVSPEAALYTLDAFQQASPDYVGHLATRSDLARAHSCAAHAHFQKFRTSDAERMSYAADERHYRRGQTLDAGLGHPAHTSLKFALHHASESARLGHVSAIVLRIGFAAREIGEGVGVDAGLLAHRAEKYRPLWRAVDDRLNALYAEARKTLASEAAARDPLEYVCGAEGCGTRSTSSAALKACSGKCPSDLKPRYCSKQSQVRDWSRHKAICKPGYGGKIPKIQNKLTALALFELEEPEPEPTPPPPPPPVRKAKPKSPNKSPPHDFRPQGDTVDGTADDKKVPARDEVEGSGMAAMCAVNVDEHTNAAEERPATSEVEGSQEVQDNEESPSSPDSECALVAPPSISLTPPSNPDDGLFDSDGLSRCTGDDEPTTSAQRYSAEEVPGETAENVADEAIEDDDAMAVANCARCGPDEDEGSEDLSDDGGLSSPDSDHAPLTPPGLPNSPRRVFFGSISPEYLKTMWEEEGPGAWTDTGVWASKVPAVFVAPS